MKTYKIENESQSLYRIKNNDGNTIGSMTTGAFFNCQLYTLAGIEESLLQHFNTEFDYNEDDSADIYDAEPKIKEIENFFSSLKKIITKPLCMIDVYHMFYDNMLQICPKLDAAIILNTEYISTSGSKRRIIIINTREI